MLSLLSHNLRPRVYHFISKQQLPKAHTLLLNKQNSSFTSNLTHTRLMSSLSPNNHRSSHGNHNYYYFPNEKYILPCVGGSIGAISSCIGAIVYSRNEYPNDPTHDMILPALAVSSIYGTIGACTGYILTTRFRIPLVIYAIMAFKFS